MFLPSSVLTESAGPGYAPVPIVHFQYSTVWVYQAVDQAKRKPINVPCMRPINIYVIKTRWVRLDQQPIKRKTITVPVLASISIG